MPGFENIEGNGSYRLPDAANPLAETNTRDNLEKRLGSIANLELGNMIVIIDDED